MNIGKILKSVVKFLKKNPKTIAVIAGTIVGGSTGAAIKKAAEKIPD